MTTVIVDCEAGRRLGCATFCCRLLVRLSDGERDPGSPDDPRKSCIDKDRESGVCVYLDQECGRCEIWNERPSICRQYDCNNDPLLQIVLRDGFTSLVDLVRSPPATEPLRRIPYIEIDRGSDPED